MSCRKARRGGSGFRMRLEMKWQHTRTRGERTKLIHKKVMRLLLATLWKPRPCDLKYPSTRLGGCTRGRDTRLTAPNIRISLPRLQRKVTWEADSGTHKGAQQQFFGKPLWAARMGGRNTPASTQKELEMDTVSAADSGVHVPAQESEDCSAGERPPEQRTVDDIINEVGFGSYQQLLMFLCGAGWAADIMDLQAGSFLLPAIKKEWNESNERLGLTASMTFLGMLAGSIFWGILSDRIGRRPVFMVGSRLAPSGTPVDAMHGC
eukprot:674693-Rhodomonas_salina.2